MEADKFQASSTGTTPSLSSLSPQSMKPSASRRHSLIKPRTFLGDGAVEQARRTDSEHAAQGIPLSEWLKMRRREQSIVSRVEAIGEDVERRDPELAAIAAQLKQKHAAEAEKRKLTYGQMLWGRLRMNDKLRAHLRQFTKRQTKVHQLSSGSASADTGSGASRRPSLPETAEETAADQETTGRWTDDPNVPKEPEEPPVETPEVPQLILKENNLEITRVRTPSLKSLRSLNSAREIKVAAEVTASASDVQDDKERKPSLTTPSKAGNDKQSDRHEEQQAKMGSSRKSSISERTGPSTKSKISAPTKDRSAESRESPSPKSITPSEKTPSGPSPQPVVAGRRTSRVSPAPVSPAERSSSTRSSVSPRAASSPTDDDADVVFSAIPRRASVAPSRPRGRDSQVPADGARRRSGPAAAAAGRLKPQGRVQSLTSPAVSPDRGQRRHTEREKQRSRAQRGSVAGGGRTASRSPVKADVQPRAAAGRTRADSEQTTGAAATETRRKSHPPTGGATVKASRGKAPVAARVDSQSQTKENVQSGAVVGRMRADSERAAGATATDTRRKSHPPTGGATVKAPRSRAPVAAKVDSRRKSTVPAQTKNDTVWKEPNHMPDRTKGKTPTAGSGGQAKDSNSENPSAIRDTKSSSKITPIIQPKTKNPKPKALRGMENDSRQTNSTARMKQNDPADKHDEPGHDLSDDPGPDSPRRGRHPLSQHARKGRPPVFATGPWAGQRRRKARQRWRRQARRSARAAARRPLDPLEPHWSPSRLAVSGPASWLRRKVWDFDWVPTEHKLGALPSFYRRAPRLRDGAGYRCQVRSANSERAGRRSRARRVAQDVT